MNKRTIYESIPTTKCDAVRPYYNRDVEFSRLLTGSQADAGGRGAGFPGEDVGEVVLGREL